MASEDHKDTPEKTDDAGQDEPKRDEAPAAPKKNGSKGFILLLAAAAVVALFVTSRREKPAGNNTPPPPAGWSVGQSVDVELTLVATDKRDLGCAHKDTIGGSKRCEFDAPKTASKTSDDKVILRPYMTTTQQPLLAAGLWSQLPPQLPAERFTVKCKFAIEGKISKPSVRWHDDGVFYDEAGDWLAGSLSSCSISKLDRFATFPFWGWGPKTEGEAGGLVPRPRGRSPLKQGATALGQ